MVGMLGASTGNYGLSELVALYCPPVGVFMSDRLQKLLLDRAMRERMEAEAKNQQTKRDLFRAENARPKPRGDANLPLDGATPEVQRRARRITEQKSFSKRMPWAGKPEA